MSTALVPVQPHYVAKKALFSFLGNTFRLYDGSGQLQYFVKQKAFKLKEEINVYADENQSELRLTIKARSISDFSGGYDIVDATTGASVGAGHLLRRRRGPGPVHAGVRGPTEWNMLGPDGVPVGKVKETGGALAILRRFITLLQWIPQKYEVSLDGRPVGTIHQQFNPFQLAYDVKVDPAAGLDGRLLVGMVVLLLAIEGRG